MINSPKITIGIEGILINQKANTENKLNPINPNKMVFLFPTLSLYQPKKNTAGIIAAIVNVLNKLLIVPPKSKVPFKNDIYDNTM